MRHHAEATATVRAEDEALALHRLSQKDRAELRAALPRLLVPVLRSVEMASEATAEPVGALGHLAFARAYITRILDDARGRLPRRRPSK